MNYTAALFSFLRVLAVALASAVLPFVTSPQGDEVPVRAITYAVVGATLLTIINFLRPGEPRFGPEPKVDPDAGYSLVEVMVAAFFAVLIVFLLLRLI